jgi:2'-5' RNA ligase
MGINNFQPTMQQVNGRFEYLLVAHPDSLVGDQICAEKEQFYIDYQEKRAVRSRPHITVANFLATEAMEPTVIKWIQRICSAQESFTVTLNNYSGFPPHTIYLRVQDPLPFRLLADQLKPVDEFIRASACPPVKLITRPHLSIARRLPEPVYKKAITDYAQKTFHASFMLDELQLLRREHAFDAWQTIQVYRLRPADLSPFRDVA